MRQALPLCVVAMILTGCVQKPPEYIARCPPPPVVMSRTGTPVAVLGDSYTTGSGMGGRGSHSWPVLAVDQLHRQGIAIDLAIGAVGATGYVKANSKGTVFADQIERSVATNDHLVVLFGSINDRGVPVEQLSSAVQCVLANTKSAAPEAKLLVIGPPWATGDPPANILGVRDVVRSQAVAAGATFVDPIAEAWFADHPELIGSDHVHPNDAGHQYLADKIAPLIALQLVPPSP